ncbi:MAG: ATP synthase F0 subunit C [Bdellovibrionales bacterium]
MKTFNKLAIVLTVLLASVAAQAQEAATAATAATTTGTGGFLAIASAIAIGLAVFGGTSAQGKAASSALEGISRNPSATDKMFTPMILSLALIESLVILAFIIAFLTIPGLK